MTSWSAIYTLSSLPSSRVPSDAEGERRGEQRCLILGLVSGMAATIRGGCCGPARPVAVVKTQPLLFMLFRVFQDGRYLHPPLKVPRSADHVSVQRT